MGCATADATVARRAIAVTLEQRVELLDGAGREAPVATRELGEERERLGAEHPPRLAPSVTMRSLVSWRNSVAGRFTAPGGIEHAAPSNLISAVGPTKTGTRSVRSPGNT